MAVAEARKMEKDEGGVATQAKGVVSRAVGLVPRKLGELKAFFAEVKSELKKVTWPSRNEVQTTTVVVIVTSVFFGFYLFGADLVFSRALSLILR